VRQDTPPAYPTVEAGGWHLLQIRLAGLAVVGSAVWYGPWMLASMNSSALWLALPFVAANLLILLNILLTAINNWRRSVPLPRLVALGSEPTVAVIVPTCGEPPVMVERTVRSVLRQNWPLDRLRVIVSDDRHSKTIASVVYTLQREYPEAMVLYHEPPTRHSAMRAGDAKSGNLNSALTFVATYHSDATYIETRDADDEVGDRDFLRKCVAQLEADTATAYVQTIKEARVGEGDPFSNLDPMFYRSAMLARNAANAVFPCGSGLVWRKAALLDIAAFPTWNLVEDLHSGMEALRHGRRGIYLPIVGAIGQHAPEDIPNVYKQRGTWALDTIRLLFWGRWRGLDLAQRLQFLELGLFYLQGISFLTIIATLALGYITDAHPLRTSQLTYVVHFWPFAAAIELFLVALNGKRPYESLLRARQMWLGLAFVYATACLLALVNGPHRKPTYRVTRKVSEFGWYWRETLPQTALIVLVVASLAYRLTQSSLLTSFDLGSAYWVVFYTAILGGFVTKSWYGIGWRDRVSAALRRLRHKRRKPLRAARA
jgi:cellulose synthase (UDP-forming)